MMCNTFEHCLSITETVFCDKATISLFVLLKEWRLSVMVQLDEVEVHELKYKMLTKDEDGLVWR